VSAREIVVRVSDMAVASADEVLVTVGLGSCVAIMLYDPETKIGGLGPHPAAIEGAHPAVRQPRQVSAVGGAGAAGAHGGGRGESAAHHGATGGWGQHVRAARAAGHDPDG
jgi:hypothetical protein